MATRRQEPDLEVDGVIYRVERETMLSQHTYTAYTADGTIAGHGSYIAQVRDNIRQNIEWRQGR